MSERTPSSRPTKGASLRDFQAVVDGALGDERLGGQAYVGVRAGDEHWMLDVMHILETSVVPSVVKSGRSPSGVAGIASFRGKILSLLDMQDLLYRQPFRPVEQGWATVLHPRHSCAVALIWPDMLGLLDTQSLLPCAFPQGANSHWVKSCWQDGQGTTWKELDIIKWLIDKGWCDAPTQEVAA